MRKAQRNSPALDRADNNFYCEVQVLAPRDLLIRWSSSSCRLANRQLEEKLNINSASLRSDIQIEDDSEDLENCLSDNLAKRSVIVLVALSLILSSDFVPRNSSLSLNRSIQSV